MRKFIAFALFALLITPSFGQENTSDKKVKPKFATFGMNAGINRSNLSFSKGEDGRVDITNGLGYRFGIISNFRFGNHFSLAPKAELSFNASQLTEDNASYSVNPLHVEFIAHLKYKFLKGKFSPYIIAGPNARLPINTGRTDLMPTTNDVAIDIGIGLDVPIFKLKVSPELRYSFGLKDILETSSLSTMKYHNIALVLNFSGH